MAMDYRKFSNTVKGMYIRWGGDIFPDYRDVSGPNVSHKRLQRAKPIVVLILKQVKEKQKSLKCKYFERVIKDNYFQKRLLLY